MKGHFKSTIDELVCCAILGLERSRCLQKLFYPLLAHGGIVDQSRTKYQEKIIKNYYRNLDAIALQKAMEQVTELFLTEGKKREQTWKRLIANLEKVGLPADQIKHLQEQDDPAVIADVLAKYV